jgi:arsenate reductase-like glutaredoxin family protein
VNLVVLPGEVVPVPAAAPPVPKAPPAPARPSLTVYYDGESEDAEDVVDALKERGHDPRLVDYRTAPPNKDELKRISIMLHETGQNLVRRYDTMFFELQLDDRFIGEAEYWTAIHEHPQLINGPVIIANGRARICKSENEALAFLGDDKLDDRKSKGMSPRMLAILAGTAPPPPELKPSAVTEKKIAAAAPAKPVAKAAAKPAAKPVEKKPAAKPAAKAKAVKAVAKPKAAAKPAAKKAAAKKK